MGVVIEIPSALKQYVNNQDEVEVQGNSVNQIYLTKTGKSVILSMSISTMMTSVMQTA